MRIVGYDSAALVVFGDFDLKVNVTVALTQLSEQFTGDHFTGLIVEHEVPGVQVLAPILEHMELNVPVVVRHPRGDLEVEQMAVRVA